MCYPKPGPHCSAHASIAFSKAKESGDIDRILQAQNDFYETPAGIRSAALVDIEKAKMLKVRREQMIADYGRSVISAEAERG